MNSFKIRFSDVLRYFILGCIELVLFYFFVSDRELAEDWQKAIDSFSPTLIIAASCISLYLLGFFTQSIILLCFRGNFLVTGIGEVSEYIRYYPREFFNKMNYPNWVYWSDSPSRVLDIYRNVLETDDSSDGKTEFLYSNQLFQGIAFSSFILLCIKLMNNPDCLVIGLASLILLIVLCLVSLFYSQHIKYLVLSIARWVIPVIMVLATLLLTKNDNCVVCCCVVLTGIYVCSVIFASLLARKQIRRIDVLANFSKENYERFNSILARVGVPKVYILTRTNNPEYIEEELESIAIQTYPNIKVIVLADKSIQNNPFDLPVLIKLIDHYQRGEGKGQENRTPMNIQLYESSRSGPAALAYEIRQIFLNYANADDIAMILDSDDKLYSRSVVSQIVSKMYKTQSNVCLIRFEIFGKENLNYSKNKHNELVKELAFDKTRNGRVFKLERCNPILPAELYEEGEMHLISTIGWTKCYKKGVLEKYQLLLKEYNKEFDTYQKYEDFPDILALLDNDTRICSVAKNSVLFRKRANSVTTSVEPDNYSVHIAHFLKLAKLLADKYANGEEKKWDESNIKYQSFEAAKSIVVDRLVPYKFLQYLNVIFRKTTKAPLDENLTNKNYTCDSFYRDIVTTVFGIKILNNNLVDTQEHHKTLEDFHSNVLSIIKGDEYDILGQDDFPETLVQKGCNWADVCNAYSLTELIPPEVPESPEV